MPPLKRTGKQSKIILPQRDAVVAAETDVLVVGGGPAGIGAAIGAKKAGADVIITERYGFFGGNATAALVMPLMSFHTQVPKEEKEGDITLMPSDHGEGSPVIAGVLKILLEKLIKTGGAVTPSKKTGYTVPFDPEVFKLTVQKLLDEYDVKFLLHSFASGIIINKKPEGVIFETKSGPVVIKSKRIVDCTGDGDICYYAGAEYDIGRTEDSLVQPMTLMFRIADFLKKDFQDYVKDHPDQWRGVHGLWDLIKKASENNDLNLQREDILFFGTPHPNELSVNSTRVTKVFGTDVFDLTYAEWESRNQMEQIYNFLKKYVPGFRDSYIVQSGINIGVRETRRIKGKYKLTGEDILEAKKFDDVVARGSYPVDVHNPEGKGTILKKLPPGESYDIPLRCLIPDGIDNILVAGRCISGTHVAHSSYRVMPISMATGHAAGVCAALSAQMDSSFQSINVKDVQKELIKQGANLHQNEGIGI
jgi:hypothetical protein